MKLKTHIDLQKAEQKSKESVLLLVTNKPREGLHLSIQKRINYCFNTHFFIHCHIPTKGICYRMWVILKNKNVKIGESKPKTQQTQLQIVQSLGPWTVWVCGDIVSPYFSSLCSAFQFEATLNSCLLRTKTDFENWFKICS